MKLTSQQYAAALFDAVSETAPKDHDKILDNFVKILASNGDLGKYEEIDAEFHKLELLSQGVKQAEVTVAKEAEMNSSLVHKLNEIIGHKVEIKKQVDESIIGGVIVRVDDTLIDASVRNQLNNLNNSLKS